MPNLVQLSNFVTEALSINYQWKCSACDEEFSTADPPTLEPDERYASELEEAKVKFAIHCKEKH
jgi:hypothetical protein